LVLVQRVTEEEITSKNAEEIVVSPIHSESDSSHSDPLATSQRKPLSHVSFLYANDISNKIVLIYYLSQKRDQGTEVLNIRTLSISFTNLLLS
jgi:hypothetical protein